MPYDYDDADTLLTDFFKAVEMACEGEGVAVVVEFDDEDDDVVGIATD